MNFRTQLIKYLNHCYADDIQSFSSIMIDMLMSNCDFRLAYDEMRQETLEDIEE